MWLVPDKGREPNSAAALASQPAAGHSLNFFLLLFLWPCAEAYLLGRPQKAGAEFGSHA